MNHKIILSYFLVIGFFICLVFAYMKYSNSTLETENDKLRQDIMGILEKDISNLQGQIDDMKGRGTSGGSDRSMDYNSLNSSIENFIKSNPEVVSKTLEAFHEGKQREIQKEAIKTGMRILTEDLDSGKIMTFAGNPKGSIKVVAFFDYSCSFCLRMLDVNKKILDKHSEVQMIFIELPMLGAESLEAAKFAIAVSFLDQSKYLDFQTKLFNSDLTRNKDNLLKIAVEAGIDPIKLQQFLENKDNVAVIEQRIKQNSIIANKIRLQGTPTYVVGDEILVGAASEEKLDDAITKTREIIIDKGEDK